eukprot:s37_g49.t1
MVKLPSVREKKALGEVKKTSREGMTPVVRLVMSQNKRTPGCCKHKYETKNPKSLVIAAECSGCRIWISVCC